MKNFQFIIFAIIILSSCSDKKSVQLETVCGSCHLEEEFRKISIEMDEFHSILIGLYNQIETNPNFVISESEKLINQLNQLPDPLNLLQNKLSDIINLRVETFYKMGEYEKSINEIEKMVQFKKEEYGYEEKYYGANNLIHLACNYVKLGDYDKAKEYLSQPGIGWYITEFINANFLEVIGEKDSAILKYEEIVSDILRDHYYHYKHSKKRLIELKKENPKLLTELFFPTDRPDAEITITDNGIRSKMFDTIFKLPECRNCGSVSVHKQPNQLNSSKYWFKANLKGGKVANYDFLIDTLTFEILVFDTISKTGTPLTEWRNRKK